MIKLFTSQWIGSIQTLLFIGILALASIIFQGIFLVAEHKKQYVCATFLKGCASLCFVIIGMLGFFYAGTSFALKIFIGLIFGMLGDIFLNMRFVSKNSGSKFFLAGIVFFLIGHVLYLSAIIPHAENLWLCIAIGSIISLALLIYFFKAMNAKSVFKIIGIFYLCAVIIMTTIALGIAINIPQPKNLLYAIGAVFFTLSDIILILNTFSGVTKYWMRITNLLLYYIGQILIAVSLFFKF